MTIISTIKFPSGRRLEKISLIKESPNLSFYTAEEHITETVDEFSSPDEIIRPVWLALSNQTDDKTLQLWKDWSRNVKGYFGVECKEAAIVENRLAAVLSLDSAQLTDKFPESKGELFISALCDMALRLDNLGFVYKNWNLSNIVQVGDFWKLLPSTSMEQTSQPNARQTLSRLGKWLMGIKTPFLQTQPARSIIEMLASGQIPDEFPEEIVYEGFWEPQTQRKPPLKINLIQNQNTIRLEWIATSNEEILLFHTDGKKKARPGQFIWHEHIGSFGTPLSDVSGINPVINADAAQWNRPQDNSRYQTLTITLAVRRENWFELGTPVVVGGPEEAVLKKAYFTEDSNEIVLSPSWSDDRSVTRIYAVIRQDRFAQNVNDVQIGHPPIVIERRLVNHPERKKFRVFSKLYIVLFNAVTVGNKAYFSAGQAESCRKMLIGPQMTVEKNS